LSCAAVALKSWPRTAPPGNWLSPPAPWRPRRFGGADVAAGRVAGWHDPAASSFGNPQTEAALADRFEGTARIDRPIEEVFAFLADGENDPKFSPRVIEIAKTSDGPPRIGTTYASTVKDAGMKTKREFELIEFEPPTRIGWTELSENLVTVPKGGYELTPDDGGTRLIVYNEFEGHGLGKLIAPLAVRAARKDANAFAQRIKHAVEAATPPT
jgi:carbon monoxide dehydrogenase subunit G